MTPEENYESNLREFHKRLRDTIESAASKGFRSEDLAGVTLQLTVDLLAKQKTPQQILDWMLHLAASLQEHIVTRQGKAN